MNDVIDEVMASKRLKKFTAFYAMIYITIQLALNLLVTYIPFFTTVYGKLTFKLFALLIEAPLMFGLIRGIFTRNYRFNEGIASFSQVKNYSVYLYYVIVKFIFEIATTFISIGVNSVKSNALSISVSIIIFILRAFLSFYIVSFYYKVIVLEKGNSPLGTFRLCIGTLKKNCGKVIGCEAFIIFVTFASLMISSSLSAILPKHELITLVITCFSSIQYGFIVLVWPIYYLCYKRAFESKY